MSARSEYRPKVISMIEFSAISTIDVYSTLTILESCFAHQSQIIQIVFIIPGGLFSQNEYSSILLVILVYYIFHLGIVGDVSVAFHGLGVGMCEQLYMSLTD